MNNDSMRETEFGGRGRREVGREELAAEARGWTRMDLLIWRSILAFADTRIRGILSLHCPRAVPGPLKCREMGRVEAIGDENELFGGPTCDRVLPCPPNHPPPHRRANIHENQISVRREKALCFSG